MNRLNKKTNTNNGILRRDNLNNETVDTRVQTKILGNSNDNQNETAQVKTENTKTIDNGSASETINHHVQLDDDYYTCDYESELFDFMNRTYNHENTDTKYHNRQTLLTHASIDDDNPNQDKAFSKNPKVPPYKKYTKDSKTYLIYMFLFQAGIQCAKYVSNLYNQGYTFSDFKQIIKDKITNWREIKIESTVMVNIAKVIMFAAASYSNNTDNSGQIAQYAMQSIFNQQQLLNQESGRMI